MRIRVKDGDGFVDYCPHPVGTWLHCEFDPNAKWPGTSWTRWDEGTYLVSSGATYKDLSNYGENAHVLTVAEMPTHTHVGYGNWACVASGSAVDGMAASWGNGEHRYDTRHLAGRRSRAQQHAILRGGSPLEACGVASRCLGGGCRDDD